MKTPTTIWYPSNSEPPLDEEDEDSSSSSGDDDESSQSDEAKWGYGVRLNKDSLRWFKLLLLDDKDLRTYLSAGAMSHLVKMRAIIKASGRDLSDIVADYLKLLWSHALDSARKHMSRIVVDESPFTVVVTVPAIWKTHVRKRMRIAVMKAGILDKKDTSFHFVSEPEAAALARLKDLRDTKSVQKGDCLTVADFGGGTVDIISYEVTSDEPFAVTDIVEGKGGLCGAIFLDQAFRKLVIQQVGHEKWDSVPKAEREHFMEQQWENGLKRTYKRGRAATVWLTGTFTQVTSQSRLKIDKETLLDFFTNNPVVRDSIALIKDQAAAVLEKTKKLPRFVVMAGGLGAMPFLNDEVELALNGEVEVIRGPQKTIWSAVSRGAVMSAGEGVAGENFAKVQARIARAC